MRRFILQRLLSIIVTLWLLATIVFLLVNVLPGNVGRQILGARGEQQERFHRSISCTLRM